MGDDLVAWVRAAAPQDDDVITRHASLSDAEGARYRGGRLDLRLDVNEQIRLVAGFGSTAMGSLVASRDAGFGWVIGRIFVEDRAREVGLGDMLLAEFLKVAAASGENRVIAQAQPGDRATKNLFERHGLVARTIVVGTDLSDRSTGEDASR